MKLFDSITDSKSLVAALRMLNMAMSEPGKKDDILAEFARELARAKNEKTLSEQEMEVYNQVTIGLGMSMKTAGLSEEVQKQVAKAVDNQKQFDNKTGNVIGLKNEKDHKNAVDNVVSNDIWGSEKKQSKNNYMK